jgi:hypothetical protein
VSPSRDEPASLPPTDAARTRDNFGFEGDQKSATLHGSMGMFSYLVPANSLTVVKVAR